MVSFSQLPAVKKDILFGAVRKMFRSFLFRDGFGLNFFFEQVLTDLNLSFQNQLGQVTLIAED